MRVLVTGSQGYIGTLLVPMLRRKGFSVLGLDLGLFEECDFGEFPPPPAGRNLDVRECTAADLTGFDAVIHLAGLSNDPLGNLDAALTFEVNYEAAVRLAWLAKVAGVARFVFASTCSVYGSASEDWIDEHSSLNPLTPYAKAKACAEAEISSLANASFSPTYLRSGTAYGSSPRLRGDLVVNNLVGYAVAMGQVLLKSAGTSWRPLVHVEDIARAMVAVLLAPRKHIHNEVFNIGRTADNALIRDIAARIAKLIPNTLVSFVDGAEHDSRSYRVCCAKLARMLPQATPCWELDDGIRQLQQDYVRFGLTVPVLEGGCLQRLERIHQLMASGHIGADLRRTRDKELASAS